MELNGSRCLVVGATGHVGTLLARELKQAGATVALTGRRDERLDELGQELDAPTFTVDVRDFDACERTVNEAADALGGLDALVLATGITAFGQANDLSMKAAEELFAVNVLGPIALIRASLGRFEGESVIVGLSAIVADYPTAGMAAYSATKAALSAYLAGVRRERRKEGLNVLDVRPQHMATGFSSDRAIEGEAPDLPEPVDVQQTVSLILGAIRDEKREIHYDLKARELVVS